MDSSSIIISGLEFLSYRVVEMKIKTLPTIGMLFTEITSRAGWDFGIGFSVITYVPKDGFYIVPVGATMKLLQIDARRKLSSDKPYLSVQATISGVFRFTEECTMDEELREKMIRQQAPAIVLPYLRATISSTLVSAGFGGAIMPLINVYEMAGKNKPVEIIHANDDKTVTPKKKISHKKASV